MKTQDSDLDEYARARLAYLTAGRPPIAAGPRRVDGPGTAARDSYEQDGDVSAALDQPTASVGSAVRWPARAAVDFARGHLAAVALVLLVAVVGTAALLVRGRATSVPVQPVPVTASGALPSSITTAAPPAGVGSPGAVSPSSAATSRLQVHVMGAVRRPGVVSLAAGARVHDAIQAAGGLAPAAATGELNLAAPLADGDQVLIGTTRAPRGEVRHAGDATTAGSDAASQGSAVTAGPTNAGGASATASAVDLNTATAEQLDQLPGVGPVTAERIVAYRTQHQRFTRVEELQEVDGIGPKTYAQIAPHVRV